jgi:hypothetical protein
MSLKQICFVSVFFSDDKDEPADPNIILEEPDDEASKSDKGPSSTAPPAVFPGPSTLLALHPQLAEQNSKAAALPFTGTSKRRIQCDPVCPQPDIP